MLSARREQSRISQKNQKNFQKPIDKRILFCYNIIRCECFDTSNKEKCGSIAQLGEHLPYKQRVIGSSPIVPTNGPVVQLVRTLACHARGQGFEPPSGRQYASVAQLVEQRTENPRVVGSIPTGGTNLRN